VKGIFLTGDKGVGKSTIVKNLMQHFPGYGFLTFFDSSKSELILKIIGGQSFLIARRNSTGKMEPVITGFDSVARKLEEFDPGEKLLIIDELGSLELCSKKFQEEVKNLLLKSRFFLCVIQKRENEFIKSLLKIEDTTLITVTKTNRNYLVNLLFEKIKGS